MLGACATAVGRGSGAGWLSAPRYRVETQFRRGRVGFERLRKVQQRVQIGRHVGSIDMCIEIPKIDDALAVRSRAQLREAVVQSSSALGAQGESVGAIELEMVSRARATRQRAPAARSRETSPSPSPEASAKRSHDFSSGASQVDLRRRHRFPAQDLRASRPI